tara:strand:- start:170 stop:499 length:330 start_codon:yes stop_codon:yes gene_type:complete
MKRLYILPAVLFVFVFCDANAQQTSKEIKSPEPVSYMQQVDETKKQEVLKQIAQIDSHLAAIEIKRNYILSNPEEKNLADEQGWFETMNKVKEDLTAKKEKLYLSINNN